MFTGIITDVGRIVRIDAARDDVRFRIETALDLIGTPIGASIACSGCCLTVVEKDAGAGQFSVDVSAESLSKTSLGSWQEGTPVNLERSLKMGDELGGHLVSGHVDGVAFLQSIIPEGGSHRLKVKVPSDMAKFIASKGSVALDGISLTVNEVEGDIFGVNIIPHTWNVTTLGQAQEGQALNLEVDIMARYAARLLKFNS